MSTDELSENQPNNKSKETLAGLKAENQLLKEKLGQLIKSHELAIETKKQTIAENQMLKEKLSEYQNEKIFHLRTKKINAIVELMQSKGLLDGSKEAKNEKIRALAKMDEESLENWKQMVLQMPSSVVTAVDNSNRKFSSFNQTIFIEDTPQKMKESLEPESLESLLSKLDWNIGPSGI